jgi:hypothetical protein
MKDKFSVLYSVTGYVDRLHNSGKPLNKTGLSYYGMIYFRNLWKMLGAKNIKVTREK